MGQHLQLYASKAVTLEDAKRWCHAKCEEIIQDLEKPKSVEDEMKRLNRGENRDHLEHWASGGGVAAFPFLTDAHLCNAELLERAKQAGREYRSLQEKFNPGSFYARHDWALDDAVLFIWEHQGFIVWGYNDGI